MNIVKITSISLPTRLAVYKNYFANLIAVRTKSNLVVLLGAFTILASNVQSTLWPSLKS